MTLEADATMEAPRTAPAAPGSIRPYYWSVRRELWETRSILIAPAVVGGVVLLGFLISAIGLPHRRLETLTLPPDRQAALIGLPYDVGAIALIVNMMIVGLFYCLAALHGERRDRTVLFWKSLPVSDLTTVLAKVSLPLLALPAVTFVIILVTQGLIYLSSSLILLAGGVSPAVPWSAATVFAGPLVLAYGIVTTTLWLAPLYGWLLLVSAWARRAPFLWAVLPPLGVGLFEHLAFGQGYLSSLLLGRLTGGFEVAFVMPTKAAIKAAHGIPKVGLAELDPGKFIATPQVWVGLVFAAACIAGCVWLRRRAEPI